jgi:dephospho-CoA kinase
VRVIGLTGPSGSGKGLFSSILAEKGIVSLDTDAVYHYITDHPGPCLSELVSAFGPTVVGENGGLSRKRLSEIVFAPDEHRSERLRLLNTITHKYVIRECEEWLSVQEKSGAAFAIIDAPLLFEAGLGERADVTVAVLAPRDVRIERISGRDGLSREEAERRTAAQKDDSYYRERADFILVNDGKASDFRLKVADFCRKIHIM